MLIHPFLQAMDYERSTTAEDAAGLGLSTALARTVVCLSALRKLHLMRPATVAFCTFCSSAWKLFLGLGISWTLDEGMVWTIDCPLPAIRRIFRRTQPTDDKRLFSLRTIGTASPFRWYSEVCPSYIGCQNSPQQRRPLLMIDWIFDSSHGCRLCGLNMIYIALPRLESCRKARFSVLD